jgi:hypothetical protein
MPPKKDEQIFQLTFEPGNNRDDLADFLAKNTEVAPVDFPKFGQAMAEIIIAAKLKPTRPRLASAITGIDTRFFRVRPIPV